MKGLNSIFFTTLHMLVKHLPKLWKIHNSSVILDNTKKQDRVRYRSVKKKRKSIHQTEHESLIPNQEICCGICQLSKLIILRTRSSNAIEK